MKLLLTDRTVYLDPPSTTINSIIDFYDGQHGQFGEPKYMIIEADVEDNASFVLFLSEQMGLEVI